MDSYDAEQVARARLAYVSAGKPPLCAPRRAAPGSGATPPAVAPAVGQVAPAAASPPRRLTRQHLVVVAVLLLCAVGVAVAALTRSAATAVPITADPAIETVPPSPTPTPMVRVHVAGEVSRPGVVTVPGGSIVQDAIAAAGGLGAAADPADLNLAAPVGDGMQIVIGSAERPLGEVRDGTAGTSAGDGAVNLNRATAAELETLPGVGPVTAQAIVAWREENGPFTSVDELQEISGIGPKTFEKLRALVLI